MARRKSSPGIFGLFGSKKSTRTKSSFRKYVWMFLAFITGSGGIAGASQYDILKNLWNIARDRLGQISLPHADSSSADTGAIKVYFTHPGQGPQDGDIAHAVVGYVDATQKTLDVCAFELNNQIITDAIVRAVKRGVRVRFVTETDYLGDSGVKALAAVGVPAVDDKRPSALMHNKFMIFDNKAVWMGSMNFTENCAYYNDNHGVYIEDPKLVENYATKFGWMHELHKFGPAPSKTDHIPNPLITLSDGTQIENYFAPHDHPANKVIDTVKLAKKSIHFLAFSFTHKGIGDAMVARAASGVEIAGVFEKTQVASGHSQYDRFKSAGYSVFLDANPKNMHHKVIIIDGEIVICGSFNFSENADKSNDENMLIIYNGAVAARFEEEFQRVHNLAKAANPR